MFGKRVCVLAGWLVVLAACQARATLPSRPPTLIPASPAAATSLPTAGARPSNTPLPTPTSLPTATPAPLPGPVYHLEAAVDLAAHTVQVTATIVTYPSDPSHVVFNLNPMQQAVLALPLQVWVDDVRVDPVVEEVWVRVPLGAERAADSAVRIKFA
jgi:hypothetical protein